MCISLHLFVRTIHGKLNNRAYSKGVYFMDYLSDSLLVEAYEKAVELNLDHDFIHMIEEELTKRTVEN